MLRKPRLLPHLLLFSLVLLIMACGVTPAAVGWSTYAANGVSFNYPSGWKAYSDPKLGLIQIKGPQGEQAIIWPVFVPSSTENANWEGVLRGLLARVLPDIAWQEAQLLGPTLLRVQGRSGEQNATAILVSASTAKGNPATLYVFSAAEKSYPQGAEVGTKIFLSFKLRGTAVDERQSAVRYVRWQDPKESAFSVEIPQEWRVEGGAVRPHPLLVQAKVEARSPDGEIWIYMGDTFPVYTEPNPTLAFAGIGPGGVYRDPMGGTSPVQYYSPGAKYLTQYYIPERHADVQVVSERERSDLAGTLITMGMNRYDAGEVEYQFRRDGQPYRGSALCITERLAGPAGSMWHVWRAYLAEAPSWRMEEATKILTRTAESFRIDPQWAQMQARLTAQQSRILAEMGNAVSNTISETYEAKWKVMDEIDRRRSNAILGLTDVVDPLTGREFKVDSGSDYYWTDPQGRMVGTQTDASPHPGVDFRKLFQFP